MTDEAIKQRLRRAKRAAFEKCSEMDYDIISSDNAIFCFVATRDTETRYVRVVIDEINPSDVKKITDIKFAGPCSKEIWLRRDDGKFKIKKIMSS
jgi:hypothetical protein